MTLRCARTLVIAALSLTTLLSIAGCAQPPAPLEPANKARDAAQSANTAIKGIQSDVDSNTPAP